MLLAGVFIALVAIKNIAKKFIKPAKFYDLAGFFSTTRTLSFTLLDLQNTFKEYFF